MVSYKNPMAHMQDRVQGYIEAMKHNRIRIKKEWRIEASYSNIKHDINEGLSALLDPLELDAILFASNSLTVAGLKKIQEYHIRVPGQLAIISFDETDVFDFFYSPVTYISQSVGEIGKEAVHLADDRIRHKKKKSLRKTVDAKLVVRESCGINLRKKGNAGKKSAKLLV
jgi:LacI family transcriptional regulator